VLIDGKTMDRCSFFFAAPAVLMTESDVQVVKINAGDKFG
jgi:hypothetical protein